MVPRRPATSSKSRCACGVAVALDQCEQCGCMRRAPHAAMRGRTAKLCQIIGAANGEATIEKNRVRHRRICSNFHEKSASAIKRLRWPCHLRWLLSCYPCAIGEPMTPRPIFRPPCCCRPFSSALVPRSRRTRAASTSVAAVAAIQSQMIPSSAQRTCSHASCFAGGNGLDAGDRLLFQRLHRGRGAKPPPNGETWQVMRLSRNRNLGTSRP